jgi:hypothetical protein
MTNNNTDKILIVSVLAMVLIAGVWTREPKVLDAFYIALGASINALAQRITKE